MEHYREYRSAKEVWVVHEHAALRDDSYEKFPDDGADIHCCGEYFGNCSFCLVVAEAAKDID